MLDRLDRYNLQIKPYCNEIKKYSTGILVSSIEFNEPCANRRKFSCLFCGFFRIPAQWPLLWPKDEQKAVAGGSNSTQVAKFSALFQSLFTIMF